MCTKIKSIYLSADEQGSEDISQKTDLTDVIVCMENGEKMVASFFTYQYLANWRKNQQHAVENMYGKYFWAPNMLLVDDCSLENINRVIQHLIEEGDFSLIFKRISAY